MSPAQPVPVRKNIPVKIIGGIANPPSVNVKVGETVEFINEDNTEKILKFAVTSAGQEFHPIGLILPARSQATIVAVNTKNGLPSDTAHYKVDTIEFGGSVRETPDDDTYQVIVGSGGATER